MPLEGGIPPTWYDLVRFCKDANTIEDISEFTCFRIYCEIEAMYRGFGMPAERNIRRILADYTAMYHNFKLDPKKAEKKDYLGIEDIDYLFRTNSHLWIEEKIEANNPTPENKSKRLRTIKRRFSGK